MYARFNDGGLETGDILLEKSYTPLGWLIGTSFREDSPIPWHDKHPKRPSNHNGTIGMVNGERVVWEALRAGFTCTPLQSYLEAVDNGKCEIKFARIVEGLTPQEKSGIDDWCILHQGDSYDYLAYVSLIWRSLLRLPGIFGVEDESHFYCTEAVQAQYLSIGKNILKDEFSSPYTVEKRIAQCRLKIVAEYWHG
jgi:hypothetical protein